MGTGVNSPGVNSPGNTCATSTISDCTTIISTSTLTVAGATPPPVTVTSTDILTVFKPEETECGVILAQSNILNCLKEDGLPDVAPSQCSDLPNFLNLNEPLVKSCYATVSTYTREASTYTVTTAAIPETNTITDTIIDTVTETDITTDTVTVLTTKEQDICASILGESGQGSLTDPTALSCLSSLQIRIPTLSNGFTTVTQTATETSTVTHTSVSSFPEVHFVTSTNYATLTEKVDRTLLQLSTLTVNNIETSFATTTATTTSVTTEHHTDIDIRLVTATIDNTVVTTVRETDVVTITQTTTDPGPEIRIVTATISNTLVLHDIETQLATTTQISIDRGPDIRIVTATINANVTQTDTATLMETTTATKTDTEIITEGAITSEIHIHIGTADHVLNKNDTTITCLGNDGGIEYHGYVSDGLTATMFHQHHNHHGNNGGYKGGYNGDYNGYNGKSGYYGNDGYEGLYETGNSINDHSTSVFNNTDVMSDNGHLMNNPTVSKLLTT